jgi:hypothetical protein
MKRYNRVGSHFRGIAESDGNPRIETALRDTGIEIALRPTDARFV